jgi:hypothetical protein
VKPQTFKVIAPLLIAFSSVNALRFLVDGSPAAFLARLSDFFKFRHDFSRCHLITMLAFDIIVALDIAHNIFKNCAYL